jgi:hypothetical protein
MSNKIKTAFLKSGDALSVENSSKTPMFLLIAAVNAVNACHIGIQLHTFIKEGWAFQPGPAAIQLAVVNVAVIVCVVLLVRLGYFVKYLGSK